MKGLRGWAGSHWAALGLALLMIVGAVLRLAPIGANRFHQDEALYSFWALQIATGRDLILNHSRVDKPPLLIYTLALCFKLFGPSEAAARLPSELSSVASIALLYYLARRLYGRAVAMAAAILMALSPFNILFAPTAFTDPLMVAWVLAALCLAAKGSLGWSGLMLGLAAATKQQGLLFVPLAAVIAARRHKPPSPAPPRPPSVPPHSGGEVGSLLPPSPRVGRGGLEGRGLHQSSDPSPPRPPSGPPHSGGEVGSLLPPSPRVGRGGLGGRGLHQSSAPAPPRTLREVFFLALGFLAVMAPVVWWDSLRWQLQPNYFEQSLISYGGLTLVGPTQLVERLGDWAEILHYVTASPFLNILLLVGWPCLLLYDLVPPFSPPIWRGGKGGEAATFFDITLTAFVILFLLGHWLLSFNVWDRYLLGLVPLLLILLARVLWLASGLLALLLSSQRPLLRGLLVALLLTTALAGPALQAARSGYPIGGDHGAYDGIEAVAGYFRDRVPAGSILYHHWLGWHYSFYVFDFPLELRWYPSPEELADDASQVDDARRYVVFPNGKLTAAVAGALDEAGLALRRVYWAYGRDGSASLTVYRIEDQK